MKSKLQALVLLSISLSVVFNSAPPADAQTHRASVRGTVYDPNRAVVPGAEVRLVNRETNEVRSTTSGEEGEFALSSLPPGSYLLNISAQGFRRIEQDIPLKVKQELRADAFLEVGGAHGSEPQTVTAAPDELKKDSASLGAIIENRQVEGLPLDGRNFYELSLLVPGAAPPAPGSAGSVRGDFSFSVNGAREDSNNFLLDGVYNVDPKLNTFGVRPPVDAAREFETLTSAYDASFGRSAGAQVNVVLKSGTNEFHGSLYEFHRNDHFDARVDHVLSDSSTLAFRYSFGDRALYEPFAGPTFAAVPGYGNDVARRGQNAMAAWTKVFGPAFVNDARIAFNRVAASVLQENRAASVNRRVGLPDLSPNPRDAGLSFITVTGFSPLGEEFNNPQMSVTNTFQFLDTATYTRGAHDRPNLVGDPNSGPRTPEQWFDTSAFAFPAPGTIGNAGRNIITGPGYQNVNASLVKNTSLGERVSLRLRAEVFNLFNHPNLNLPDNFLGSPTFGQVTSARDPRHIQFGAKLLF